MYIFIFFFGYVRINRSPVCPAETPKLEYFFWCKKIFSYPSNKSVFLWWDVPISGSTTTVYWVSLNSYVVLPPPSGNIVRVTVNASAVD